MTTGLQAYYIAGYNPGGLQLDKKPFMLPDQAFSKLMNAYVWRERVLKRDGLELLGRLRRDLVDQVLNVTAASNVYTNNGNISIFTTLALIATEPNAEVAPLSVVITIDDGGANETVVEDTLGTGILSAGVPNNLAFTTGYFNYATGQLHLNFAAPIPAALAVIITFGYYPRLPVMGIWQQELPAINDERTVFFDTKYAYIWNGTTFQQYLDTTTSWLGTDSDFFWADNYRGTNPQDRLFFVTNFVCNNANPMRYNDGTTWTAWTQLVDATHTLWSARLIIAYYGRLLALNVWEGTTAGGRAAAVNIVNRVRFSQVGNPIQADAWQVDIYGKGGFIDAPTSEAIISAGFIKNTLIVYFEHSTWQLRYVGEYGLPFIWERISSDFGCESTNSTVVFDQGLLAVGDKGIIKADGDGVGRIDEVVPDIVFFFTNVDNAVKRVVGVRDFQKELVYWCYNDANASGKYPGNVLVYNYKTGTWSIFEDNVTYFGTFQRDDNITWDSQTVTWDDQAITWDTDPSLIDRFPTIVIGNQQGFIHFYQDTTPDEESLSIRAVDVTTFPAPIQLTIPNHNLENGDIISIDGLSFINSSTVAPIATNLNDRIYQVQLLASDPLNKITLLFWDDVTQPTFPHWVNVTVPPFTPANVANLLYVGGGRVTLYPRMVIQSKDFNPFGQTGGQIKLTYLDLLTDTPISQRVTPPLVSIFYYTNTSTASQGNLLVGNTQLSQNLDAPYYVPASDYAWHRLYAGTSGNFVRVIITYDDSLMANFETHQDSFVLNAISLWIRQGGKTIF